MWRYCRVKDSLSLASALLNQKPTQQSVIDIDGLLIKKAEEQIPGLIQQKLRRLLR